MHGVSKEADFLKAKSTETSESFIEWEKKGSFFYRSIFLMNFQHFLSVKI